MTHAPCPTCKDTRQVWNNLLGEMRPCIDCVGGVFFHATPKADACDHDFTGWREFSDGNGGEQVCSKCSMGAMAYSLATGI